MYGVPPRGPLQGQTRDNSNTRYCTLKGTHIYVFLYNICRIYIYIYMSYHILFEGVCFVLSYFTHIWNAHVAENLLKTKKTRKMKHAYLKDKACLIILKR